jgi:UrcA family protein
MRKTALTALALIAATVSPSVAQALAPATATTIVRTADLNLATVDGQRELDRRIVRAAYDVCGEASDIDLEGKNDVRRCRTETVAAAAAQRRQLIAIRGGAPIRVASAR